MTAVEWLEKEFLKLEATIGVHGIMYELIEQAKEIEELQHKETWFDSTAQFDNASEMTYKKDFDDYFNEKYKNKQ